MMIMKIRQVHVQESRAVWWSGRRCAGLVTAAVSRVAVQEDRCAYLAVNTC
jgi:hypothetical protein